MRVRSSHLYVLPYDELVCQFVAQHMNVDSYQQLVMVMANTATTNIAAITQSMMKNA